MYNYSDYYRGNQPSTTLGPLGPGYTAMPLAQQMGYNITPIRRTAGSALGRYGNRRLGTGLQQQSRYGLPWWMQRQPQGAPVQNAPPVPYDNDFSAWRQPPAPSYGMRLPPNVPY